MFAPHRQQVGATRQRGRRRRRGFGSFRKKNCPPAPPRPTVSPVFETRPTRNDEGRALSRGVPRVTRPHAGSVHAGLATTGWRWCVSTQSACVLPGLDLTQPSLGAGSRPLAFARVHGVSPPRGSVLLAKFAGGKTTTCGRESSRGGWGRARCMTRRCGRCLRTVVRSQVPEDHARRPRR